MPEPIVHRKIQLEGTCRKWEDAGAVLLGVPLDETSSFRPGSRFAPEAIRSVFWETLEDYSMYQGKRFTDTSLFDWGDLSLTRGNIKKEIEEIREAVDIIVGDGKTPILLGGEHSITVAGVKSLLEKHPTLAVIQLDAHADLRPEYLGESLSHASTAYRLLEMGVNTVYQVGVRSCTSEEKVLAEEKTRFFPFKVKEPLEKVIAEVADLPVYISLDIDVVDPAFAPGTGTPEPGGISSGELLHSILMFKEINLVGFDLVEVCPLVDSGSITSMLAAKIVREVAVMLG